MSTTPEQNRDRLHARRAASFMPQDGEDFFSPSILDDWTTQRSLVMYRVDEADRLRVAQDARIEALDSRLNGLTSEMKLLVGKIIGGALVVSVVAAFIFELIRTWAQGVTP